MLKRQDFASSDRKPHIENGKRSNHRKLHEFKNSDDKLFDKFRGEILRSVCNFIYRQPLPVSKIA